MPKNKATVYVAVLIAMAIWGFSYIWSKQVFEFYSPVTTIFSRLFISAILLWAYLLISKKYQKIERKDLKTFFYTALFQPFIYFIGENYGLEAVPNTTVTSVMIATIPLFTPIATFFTLKEKLTSRNAIGIIVSFIGVVFVVSNNQFDIQAPLYGLGLLFIAVIAAVINGLLLQSLSSKYNVLMLITIQNTIGMLMFFVLFFFVDYQEVIATGFHPEVIVPILLLAVFASTIAYLFFTYGIAKIGITQTNVFANVIPVFTAAYAFIVFGEVLTLMNMSGILLVITGLIISQKIQNKNPENEN